MKVSELTVAKVTDNDEIIGYAGSQEWFPTGWEKMSGCGATAAAGAASTLAFSKGLTELLGPANAEEDRVEKSDFVRLMREMFSRMTPRIMGYPYAAKWGRAFKKYAGECGISLKADVFDHWTDWRKAWDFVKQHIFAGVPVPALILYHKAPEMKEELWHWVLITGFTEPENGDEITYPQIIVSDCAERDLYSAEIFLDADTRNLVKLVDLTF